MKEIKISYIRKISYFVAIFVFLFSAFYFLFFGFNLVLAEDQEAICDQACAHLEGAEQDDCFNNCIAGSISATCDKYGYPWCSEAKEGIAPLVNNFYKIALGFAGASALGVLIYGAILWTLSGAVTSKQDAMEWIKGALWGLALLLGAYLILWTINPKLVELEDPMKYAPEVIVPEPPEDGGGGGGGTQIQGGTEDHKGDGDVGVTGTPTLGTPSSDTQNLKSYAAEMKSSNTSVMIDKSDKKMYIYYRGKLIATLPIGIGRGDLNGTKTGGYNGDKITPAGEFTITSDKRVDTVNGVYNKEGVHMGSAFLGISATDEHGNIRGIGIHGNKSGTLGNTAGCIRVKNADLPAVYAALKPGTKVKIQN